MMSNRKKAISGMTVGAQYIAPLRPIYPMGNRRDTIHHVRLFTLFIILMTLSACGASSTDQQTMVAYNTAIVTQRAVFYLTATVEAERGFVTLDAIQDRIDRAIIQRQFMLSTLEARGVDISRLPQLTTPTPAPFSPTPSDSSAITATPMNGDVALPTAVVVTLIAITPTSNIPQATPNANSPLRDVVMSQGVGNDDCAVGVTNTFSVNTAEIYVVARAVGIQAGTNLGASWAKADGTALVRFDFTPDFDIENACIWFFAAPEDFPFEAGGYSVVLDINNVPVGTPIPFIIAP
ncbi:MAG TPA: hypothetical protein PLZ51_10695 [Aggregatilineales bacterium]|nr:hypothetical protein [Aggregatilineales bacterium]